MKTLVYSIHNFEKEYLSNASKEKIELSFTESPLNINSASLAEGYDAVALFSCDIASAEVLHRLHSGGVKYIALRSVGYDHVDINAAISLGIRVANVPAYSPNAIAEHAVALLLALNRKLMQAQQQMQENDFRLDNLVGFDLCGKTVGIVGTGKIGAVFATIMKGFGCKLLGYDIEENQELISTTNIEYTTLDNLCGNSDVISVHCPLNNQTKYMFNRTTFAQMKQGVVFINTARGGIVNTLDLLDALDSSIVSFAGLDVYEKEKPIYFYDHSGRTITDDVFAKLRNHPNVLLTGHQAFLTHEALGSIAHTTINNLQSWMLTGESKNEIH